MGVLPQLPHFPVQGFPTVPSLLCLPPGLWFLIKSPNGQKWGAYSLIVGVTVPHFSMTQRSLGLAHLPLLSCSPPCTVQPLCRGVYGVTPHSSVTPLDGCLSGTIWKMRTQRRQLARHAGQLECGVHPDMG